MQKIYIQGHIFTVFKQAKKKPQCMCLNTLFLYMTDSRTRTRLGVGGRLPRPAGVSEERSSNDLKLSATSTSWGSTLPNFTLQLQSGSCRKKFNKNRRRSHGEKLALSKAGNYFDSGSYILLFLFYNLVNTDLVLMVKCVTRLMQEFYYYCHYPSITRGEKAAYYLLLLWKFEWVNLSTPSGRSKFCRCWHDLKLILAKARCRFGDGSAYIKVFLLL